MKNLKKYLIYALFGITGIIIGAILFNGDSSPETIEDHIAENHTNNQGEVIYTCSMHPQIRQKEPGNCPICGMELIPADEATSETGPNDLVMTAASIKLAEIETTPVSRTKPVSVLRMPGKVVANQNLTSAITAHIPGRIINLYVDFEGDYVQAGQRVASIYSPELIAAQQELLETAKYKEQNPILFESARKKLELWELPVSTIDEIIESKTVMESVDIVSPVSGFVQRINVQRQQHVMEGALMYQVADLSSVWVMFDAFETQTSLLKNGLEIQFTTVAYPGKTFSGKVDYVDPVIQNNSRSLRVRVEAKNKGNILKPNMLVEGTLNATTSQTEQLIVPRSAILWTGTRSVVFVKKPNTDSPTFAAREITLGQRVGDYFIVIEGLNEGEEVVTNGTFKLDSAAQLADKLSMMNREPGTGADRVGHEGHTMPDTPPSTVSPDENAMNEISVVPAAFKQQLKAVVSEYLVLKDALASADRPQSTAAATLVSSSLSEVNMELLKGESHMEWMRFLNNLKTNSEIIAKATSIEQQRKAFMILSSKLIEVVKHFEIPGVYYQQFCPMSNNGDGAYWLSADTNINNPYLDDQMHDCGETITKIEH